MFMNRRTSNLKARIHQLEEERDTIIDNHQHLKQTLQQEINTLKDQLSDLERKRKHEEEDIAHLVKIKESKLDIEFQKRVQENDAAKEKAIAKVKDEYRDKLEKQLREETARIEKMYGEILARLPNINVKLGGKVG